MLANAKTATEKRLLLVFGFSLLLLVILSATWSAHRELESLRRNGLQSLSLYAKVVSNELRRHEYLPLALAKNGDIINFLLNQADTNRKDQLNHYLEQVNAQTDATALYLLNAEGLTIASSNWRSPDTYVGHNYSFRPYFKMSISGKPGHYFAVGATTKTPGLFLSCPVDFEGRILGVVAIKVSMVPLEQAWASQGDEKVFLTDDYGVIFASNEPAWKFRTLTLLAEETLLRLRQSRKYLELDLRELGVEHLPWSDKLEDLVHIPLPTSTYYLKQQVPLTGTPWVLHICSSMAPVVSAAVTALLLSSLGGMCLLLLCLDFVDHRRYLQERKRYQFEAKQKLKISAAEQRAIIGHTQAALAIVTPQGEVELFNPTAERYFGYAEDEIKGQSLLKLLDPSGREALEGCFLSTNGQVQDVCQVETLAVHRDGSRFPIDLIASEIHLHRGLRFIVTIHDIGRLKAAEKVMRCALEEQEQRVRERTAELSSSNQRLLNEIVERQQAEKVLKDTQDDLIQASKLAALGQMSAGVVHELNQPIAAIRNFTASSKLLLKQNHLAQVEKNLQRIVDLTERMAKITGQLKIFARKGGGERKKVSLKVGLDRALVMFDDRIRRSGVNVQLDLPAASLDIDGDSLRLEQVLINLIGNALDAMDKTRQPLLQISASAGTNCLALKICDNGSGIAEEHLPQLFDPFFTTKEVGEGLGLGLSISYGIVRDWGGAIRVGNRQGGGSEFVVELPLTGEGHGNG